MARTRPPGPWPGPGDLRLGPHVTGTTARTKQGCHGDNSESPEAVQPFWDSGPRAGARWRRPLRVGPPCSGPARPHPIRPPALLHGYTARRLGRSRRQPRHQRRPRGLPPTARKRERPTLLRGPIARGPAGGAQRVARPAGHIGRASARRQSRPVGHRKVTGTDSDSDSDGRRGAGALQ